MLPVDHLWVLARGEVVVERAERSIELWIAPCSLDIAGTMRGEPSASFIAAGSIELIGVPRAHVASELLAELLVLESDQLWQRIERDARRDDDMFLPGAVPVPGPWWFRRARAIVMVVEGDIDRIKRCMPRGVHSVRMIEGRYLLVLAQFDECGSQDASDTRRFSYREVTPFIPAWVGLLGGLCAFVPELYPDAWMATILGREIHGFPKRTARIGLRGDGGEMLLDRRLALRVRWAGITRMQSIRVVSDIVQTLVPYDLGEELSAHLVKLLPDRLGFSALVRKRIGAAQTSGRTFEVDRLVRVPIQLDPIHTRSSYMASRRSSPTATASCMAR